MVPVLIWRTAAPLRGEGRAGAETALRRRALGLPRDVGGVGFLERGEVVTAYDLAGADRAGGVYFRNFTVQQAEFNALYVLETDGFVVDRVVARGNDEYGILAFAADHGLIQRTDNYWNGDSGIYPGSASDINANTTEFEMRCPKPPCRNGANAMPSRPDRLRGWMP